MADLYARLLVQKRYPAAWVFTVAPIPVGSIVRVVPATNIPQEGNAIRYWVDSEELKDDAYGVGLYDGEFLLLPPHEDHPEWGHNHLRCERCRLETCHPALI